jgi:hypothetical protein
LTPPYTVGLVSRSPSSAAQRLPTPSPPQEPPRRRLVVRIRRPATEAEGVGVFPDLNIPAHATETATGNVGFGPQAGPAAIYSRSPPQLPASPNLRRQHTRASRRDHGGSPRCPAVLLRRRRPAIRFLDTGDQRGGHTRTEPLRLCGGHPPSLGDPARHLEPSCAGAPLFRPLKAG